MNRRIWVISIALIVVTVCVVCGGGFTFFLGLAFDQGPFSSESRAQFRICFQGGTRILLETDVPEGTTVSYQAVKIAGRIIQLRLQAFGVDSIVRIKDERHLTIELPDAVNTSQLVTATGSGFLEFVNAGDTPLQKGQVVHTTGLSMAAPKGQSLPSAASTTSPVYQTVMTGQDVRSAGVAFQQVTNQPYIQFTLTDNGSKIFADFTEKNVGKCLAIVLDKKVISSPVIKSPITDGSGIIEGRFTADEANGLVVQLKYGALPVPVKIIETTAIPR